MLLFIGKLISKILLFIKLYMFDKYAKQYCNHKHVIFNADKCRFDGHVRLEIEDGCNVTLYDNVRICSDYNSIDNSSYGGLFVKHNATLSIGENTGMVNTMIWCYNNINIGRNVNIGAGCLIMDTNFHSLNWQDRLNGTDTEISKQSTAPINIGYLVFIGARSIILKGVTIGAKSIVGAGSVVSCNIPAGEIWAGNPAKFIKKIPQ